PPSRMTHAQRSRIAANTPIPWPCYCDIAGHSNPRKGTATIKRTPRHKKTPIGMRRDGSARAQLGDQTPLRRWSTP
ncbi:MAG: hypothetical protein ACRD36_12845, partial [Candidatus Acidiferrum sp.]